MQQQRLDLEVGDRFITKLPWSEVCMYMGVAEKVMQVEVRENGAQLYTDDDQPFSAPITWGEAGIFTDSSTGRPYTYDADKHDPGVRGCGCGMADEGESGHDHDSNQEA